MKSRAAFTVGFIALLISVSTASAQQQPQVPGNPNQPDVEDVQKRAERGAAPSWTYSLGVGESYESDVSFSGAEGNGDWARNLTGHLSHIWVLRRGNVEAGGDVTHNSYHEAEGVSRVTYAFNGGTSYALTRRLNWRMSGSVNQMYSQDAQILIDSGVIYPRVLTRTQGTFLGFTYLLTPRSQLDLSVSTTRVAFVDSDLIPGTSLLGRAAYSRTVSRGQSIGVSIGHSISNITGDIEGIMGTWQMTPGPRFTLHAEGGVRPYKLNEHSTQYSFVPGGSAGFAATFGRAHTAGFTYEYAVEQAYGVGGTHFANRYNSNYSVKIGRLGLDANGSYGRNSYPDRPGYNLDGRNVNFGGQYLIGKGLALGASYGLWIRHATDEPSTTTYRTMISLSYGGGWR